MGVSIHIDSLDKKIIKMITQNARIPYLEVARECNVSGAAIHQRIQKLTKLGVITGSKFTLEPKKIGYKTCAYMGIFLEQASLYNDVLQELRKIPEITQCHFTTGNYSIFIKIYTHDNEHLKAILSDKIQLISGIARTETFISLEEGFNRSIPID
ncbi:MAG: Lrp/AsnC ligand binding domain-containing protein [Bacteroidales bacterium]|nr:Lrp/AsnC ligand binding domain-containing protein [Bacteroidales bacterium]